MKSFLSKQKGNAPSLSKGFTLIELLVVIGILAVLLAITLIAINPARQFAQANNTQRSSDVNAILNAVGQFAADNNGTLPAGIPVDPNPPGNMAVGAVDICNDLVPLYIAQLPVDPQNGNWTDCLTYDTQYEIVQQANSRVTVSAPDTELGVPIISVTR